MTFQELNLSKPILRAVARAGYEKPSPIQAGAIPPVLKGQDLMGCAQTGTGKTAAFALPILDLLSARQPKKPGAVRALVLTPTRELALQIGESFAQYGQYLKLRSAVIFGGVGQAPQVEKLRQGVDILVACPGRLNDLIGQGYVDLSGVEIFVLDEADRMLDMGFVHDVKRVIAKLPVRRQTLMFSATMPAEIEQLAAGILRDPAFVKVDPVSSTVDRIAQSLYYVSKTDKRKLLPWLIQNLQPPVHNALVFSRTKHGADRIARDLVKQGIPAAAIHGNKSQSARVAALEEEDFARKAERYDGAGDVLLVEGDMSSDSVRRLCDAVQARCGGRCAVFAGADGSYKYAIGQPGGDLRALVKELNAALSGRGGGKPAFVQGSVQAGEEAIRAFFAGK